MSAASRSYRIYVLMVYACLVSSHLNAIIMIRKNSLFCKLIRIKTSSKFIFDSYMAKFHPELETCPVCGSCGNCHIHAYYDRSVIDFCKGQKVRNSLCVLRLSCDSCNHTHAILPDVLIPYACYSLMFILRVLGEWFLGSSSMESLCDRFSISPVQLRKWIKLWEKHKLLWLGILDDSEISHTAFLKSLAVSVSYSAFSMPFIQGFSFSFLQSHKNPIVRHSKNAHYCQSVFKPDISIW